MMLMKVASGQQRPESDGSYGKQISITVQPKSQYQTGSDDRTDSRPGCVQEQRATQMLADHNFATDSLQRK